MAVSGSKNYWNSITRSLIIESALRKLGVYDQGEAVPGEEISSASIALNLMIKEWVADGADIFLRTESTLFLQPNTQSYELVDSSGTVASQVHITDSYFETTLTADAALGSTTFTVADDTTAWGLTSLVDYVGVKQDDDTIHWALYGSSTTTTISNNATTTAAASSGNKVYAYTTKSDRPAKIIFAYRSDKNGHDTEVALVGEFEYRGQSNKKADGPPVEVWFNPQGNQDKAKLWVWPDDGGADWDKLVLICQHYPDDMDAQADNADFPAEWGNALVWGLAAELASEYGLPENEQGRLWQIAQHKLDKVLDYDVENADVQFGMDYRR